MKAFSLIELLTGLTMSMLLLGGFLAYTKQSTQQFRNLRQKQLAESHLRGTQTALRNFFTAADPQFWEAFPPKRSPIHPITHQHEAFQLTHQCPNTTTGDCAVYWDLHPLPQLPIAYKVMDHDWPEWVHLSPQDEFLPLGPGDELESHKVLLFVWEAMAQPLLISEIAGDYVYLAPVEQQPWPIEVAHSEPSFSGATILCLGRLSVTHLSLVRSPKRHFALRYQPWQFQGTEWKPLRSWSDEPYLIDLTFTTEPHPGLHLVSQAPNPQVLPQPKTIGGRTYDREINHAWIALPTSAGSGNP